MARVGSVPRAERFPDDLVFQEKRATAQQFSRALCALPRLAGRVDLRARPDAYQQAPRNAFARRTDDSRTHAGSRGRCGLPLL